MEDGRQGVQADQPVSGLADGLVQVLQLMGEILVLSDQGRQGKAEEGDGVALCAQGQPSEQRQGDHAAIKRHMRRRGGPTRPAALGREPGHLAPRDQPDPDQDKHRQAQHEMPGLQSLAHIAAARIVRPQFDAGEDGGQQDQHQPVESDREPAVVGVAGLDVGYGCGHRWFPEQVQQADCARFDRNALRHHNRPRSGQD